MTQVALILLIVAVLGMAAVVAGVAMLWGAAIALMVGGGLAVATAVTLVDPAEMRGKR